MILAALAQLGLQALLANRARPDLLVIPAQEARPAQPAQIRQLQGLLVRLA